MICDAHRQQLPGEIGREGDMRIGLSRAIPGIQVADSSKSASATRTKEVGFNSFI